MNRFGDYADVPVKQAVVDAKHTWLTEKHHAEFDTFIALGSREAKAARGEATDVIFARYSNGVKTNRDSWVYNFDRDALTENMRRMIDTYNEEVFKWERREDRSTDVDSFVASDTTKIGWSSGLKQSLRRGTFADLLAERVRTSLFRPFIKSSLYFDRMMIERVYVFPSIFPKSETENRVLVVSDHGFRTEFSTLVTDLIPDVHALAASDAFQCFSFYTYDEDGSNRRENVTDWSLAQFRTHYGDNTISKWDIFHYVYGLLHHPGYRERYQANLKRELPRIPFVPDFRAFAEAGARLAQIHVGYEEQPEYPLAQVETPDMPLDWRVEKMRLSKDKTQLRYNSFLTLDGIPSEVFNYRLGNRSALEWIIDQYRVKTDRRSGIVNDPNRAVDPEYIVRLIGKVISVSLETVKVVEGLPELGIDVGVSDGESVS